MLFRSPAIVEGLSMRTSASWAAAQHSSNWKDASELCRRMGKLQTAHQSVEPVSEVAQRLAEEARRELRAERRQRRAKAGGSAATDHLVLHRQLHQRRRISSNLPVTDTVAFDPSAVLGVRSDSHTAPRVSACGRKEEARTPRRFPSFMSSSPRAMYG